MLFVTGCGSNSEEDLIAKFEKNVENSKSYTLKGNMEILSNEETFTYSIEANYLKGDYYKVTLVNQTNNHEQIILKNSDGVYVVTPTLNKSFKFQSEWPSNSSQSYILSSLLNDIKNDENMTLEQKDDNYIITTTVNYPNNSSLTYQKIYFDKDMNIEQVEVYDNEDIVNIKVAFSSIDLKSGLNEEDFLLEDLIDMNAQNEENKESNTTTNPQTNNNTTQKTLQCNSNSQGFNWSRFALGSGCLSVLHPRLPAHSLHTNAVVNVITLRFHQAQLNGFKTKTLPLRASNHVVLHVRHPAIVLHMTTQHNTPRTRVMNIERFDPLSLAFESGDLIVSYEIRPSDVENIKAILKVRLIHSKTYI